MEAKEKAWEEFGRKMEEDRRQNQKLFYKVLKTLRKGKTKRVTRVKNKQGEITKTNSETMDRWKEYFEELLEAGQEEDSTNMEDEEQTNRDELHEDEEKITKEEMEEAIKKVKNGKAPGYDKVTPEMVKEMGEEGKKWLLTIYNKAWKEENIPQDWEIGQIVPIHKKGDNKQCDNYRGITLLSTLSGYTNGY